MQHTHLNVTQRKPWPLKDTELVFTKILKRILRFAGIYSTIVNGTTRPRQAMINYGRHSQKRCFVNTCPDPFFYVAKVLFANDLRTSCCLEPQMVEEHIFCIT